MREVDSMDLGLTLFFFCFSWACFKSAYYLHNNTISVVKRFVVPFRTESRNFVFLRQLKSSRSDTASDCPRGVGLIVQCRFMVDLLYFRH